jgi:type VI secretion system protein ImpE
VNVGDFYRAGQLAQATAAAIAEVKTDPGNVSKRRFLSDLLCVAGDLERADRQLEAAVQFGSPMDLAATALRRQLIRAELARRQFFNEGRLPEFPDLPSEDVRRRLQAAVALREGALEEAGKLLAAAEAQRQPLSGICMDSPFDSFSDLDELVSSLLEVYSSTGKYYWIPLEQVRRIEFLPPITPRDLLWRCARLVFRQQTAGAPEGVVYLPALYHGSHNNADDLVKLGRATVWTGGGGAPYRGSGQRIFEVGGVERSILELTRVEFGATQEGEG